MIKHCAKGFSFFFIWLFSCTSPAQENAIRVRLAQDPESLHPLSYGNAVALQVLNLMYQSLLTIDLADKSIQPLLAIGLPTVERDDSLSYFTFTLRPEARWDNGLPVTAQDVAFSLKLLHSPLLDNERWRAQYGFIKDIRFKPNAPSSITLVCAGYTPEMKLLTGDFFVLPAHKLDPKGLLTAIPYATVKNKYDSLAGTATFKGLAMTINQPALARDTAWLKGSGPYALKSWKPGQQLRLERKSNWWGATVSPSTPVLQAKPDKLLFKIIPDNAAAILALKAGQLDVMDNMPMVPFLEMKNNPEYQKNFTFHTPISYELVFMGINGDKPYLQEKRTRQALAHLVNVHQIINSLQGGFAAATVGLVHPEEKDFYNSALPPVSFDTQKATQLLAEAGWTKTPEGWQRKRGNQTQQLQLEIILRAGNSDFENMALLFKQNAGSIGIPVTLQALESSQVGERIQSGNYDLFFRTLSGNPFSYNLIPFLHTSNTADGGANVTHFGTPATDKLLEEIATEEDREKQARLLKELQQQMRQESNLVPLYFLQNKIVLSRRIASAVISPIKPSYDLSRFALKK